MVSFACIASEDSSEPDACDEQKAAETAAKVKLILCEAEPIHLNKAVNRILALPILSTRAQSYVARAILETIIDDIIDEQADACSKHARCGETYADIVKALCSAMPSFDASGDKPMTFTRILLRMVQDAFEASCLVFPVSGKTEARETLEQHSTNNLIALVSFIGHLFVRRLVALRIIGEVAYDLIGSQHEQPKEPPVQCACELLHCIGQAVDVNPQEPHVSDGSDGKLTLPKHGPRLLAKIIARLTDLAALQSSETQQPIYSTEVRDAIHAVYQARLQNWPARAGTHVLVQYHIVSQDEAVQVWADLFQKGQLPFGQAALAGSIHAENGGHALRIASFLSGENMAVLFGQNVDVLQEHQLKLEISSATAIHPGRLMVFRPDGCLPDSRRGTGTFAV